MNKRLMLAAVVYPMVQSVLFGTSLVALVVPFGAAAWQYLFYVAAATFVVAVPIAWLIAPRLSLELSGKDRVSRLRAAGA